MANPKRKAAKKRSRAAKEKLKRNAGDRSARSRPAKGAPRSGTLGRGANPERVKAILRGLDEAYPASTTALKHDNAFQLLISTILSAQSTDVRVNMVTPGLFEKYPTPAALAYANPKDIEQEIRSTGFYRNKTKSIIGASKKIVEEFHGEVPRTMEEILTLPGVARKTANVVLGTAFGIASGIVVDTHVQRVSGRLDLTKNADPKKIETDLMKIIPQDRWILFSHQLIWHGRRVCQARKPKCIECNLEKMCYSKDKTI
jgi:endonuclease III